MFGSLKNVTTGQWVVGACMIVLIAFGTYMSYRPYRAPVAVSSAPIVAPVYL
jgi:hypothetical protein